MSFRFSLQKILDLRLKEVNEAQKEVILTENRILQLRRLLEQERLQYFSDRDELNVVVKKVEFTEIKIYEKSLSIRQNKMMELLRNIRDLQSDLTHKQSILIQAKLNQKVVTKLHDIKAKEYEKKEALKEQYLLDEMAVMAFRRNTLEEDSNE